MPDVPDDRHNYEAAPGPLAWRSSHDRDLEAIGVVTAALAGDEDATVALLNRLTKEQLSMLCWTACHRCGRVLNNFVTDSAETSGSIPLLEFREVAEI